MTRARAVNKEQANKRQDQTITASAPSHHPQLARLACQNAIRYRATSQTDAAPLKKEAASASLADKIGAPVIGHVIPRYESFQAIQRS
jgi:hypothetical protein